MWWLEAVCKSLGQACTCWFCSKFPQWSWGILRWKCFAGGQAGQSMLHFKWVEGESGLWGRGLKVVSASFVDGTKVICDGLEFSLRRHELPLPIPELDTTVSLFGGKEASSFIQRGWRGRAFGLLQNGINTLLFPLLAPLSKFFLEATNRLAKVEGLGSLGKRGSWLLLEKVFKVPKAFDARFGERRQLDLRGITSGFEPVGVSNVLPGLGELCIEVITGIVSGLMWVQLETACRHVAELLGDFWTLFQTAVRVHFFCPGVLLGRSLRCGQGMVACSGR